VSRLLIGEALDHLSTLFCYGLRPEVLKEICKQVFGLKVNQDRARCSIVQESFAASPELPGIIPGSLPPSRPLRPLTDSAPARAPLPLDFAG
jgi:hypothetical protein